MAVYTEVAQIVGLYPPVSIAQNAAIGYNAPVLNANGVVSWDNTADLVFVVQTSEGNWEITQSETPPPNELNTGQQAWGPADIHGDRCAVVWMSGIGGTQNDKLYIWEKRFEISDLWEVEETLELTSVAYRAVKVMGDEIALVIQPPE